MDLDVDVFSAALFGNITLGLGFGLKSKDEQQMKIPFLALYLCKATRASC